MAIATVFKPLRLIGKLLPNAMKPAFLRREGDKEIKRIYGELQRLKDCALDPDSDETLWVLLGYNPSSQIDGVSLSYRADSNLSEEAAIPVVRAALREVLESREFGAKTLKAKMLEADEIVSVLSNRGLDVTFENKLISLPKSEDLEKAIASKLSGLKDLILTKQDHTKIGSEVFDSKVTDLLRNNREMEITYDSFEQAELDKAKNRLCFGFKAADVIETTFAQTDDAAERLFLLKSRGVNIKFLDGDIHEAAEELMERVAQKDKENGLEPKSAQRLSPKNERGQDDEIWV